MASRSLASRSSTWAAVGRPRGSLASIEVLRATAPLVT